MTGVLGTYVIAAGGTGGHILPGVALAEEIRAQRPTADIVFVGTAHGLEGKIVPAAGYPLELVDASGFVGKTIGKQVQSLARLPSGFLAGAGSSEEAPRAGGRRRRRVRDGARAFRGALPRYPDAHPRVQRAARRRQPVPQSLRDATAVGLAAANTHLRRGGVVTGTPVRSEFFAVPPFDPAATTRRVLVFGGSQGSRVINRAMSRVAVLLEKSGIEVVHQTGDKDLAATRQRYPRIPAGWKLVPFLPKLAEQMEWADLVVCRSGAMTVAELAAAGRPSILVPFGAAAGGHQMENARALYRAGAAAVMEEKDLTAENLAGGIDQLLKDRPKLVLMGQKAKTLGKPDAARELARLLFP